MAIQKASQAYDVLSVSGYTAQDAVSEGMVVKMGTTHLSFAICGDGDADACGIAKATYADNEEGCSVQHYGIANVLSAANETYSPGEYVVAGATGYARALAGGDGAGVVIIGRSTSARAVGAAPEMIPVLLLWQQNLS